MTHHDVPSDGVLGVALSWCRLAGAATPGQVETLLTEQSIVYGLARAPVRGVAAIQAALSQNAGTFPHRTCEVLDWIVEDDRAAVRWTMTFVPKPQQMEGMPAALEGLAMEAVELPGLTMCTVRDGRIVELHTSIARWWV
jgi:hypothetical protein